MAGWPALVGEAVVEGDEAFAAVVLLALRFFSSAMPARCWRGFGFEVFVRHGLAQSE